MRQGQICELAASRTQQSTAMNMHGKQSTRTRVYGAFGIPTRDIDTAVIVGTRQLAL